MFDDSQQSNSALVPPNLPIGEPEDIFARVEPAAEDMPDVSSPLANDLHEEMSSDMPSPPETKTALSAGILHPKEDASRTMMSDNFHTSIPMDPPRSPQPTPPFVKDTSMDARSSEMPERSSHTLSTDVPELYSLKEPKASKGIITIIIIVVVVFVLGGGGLFIYQRFIAGKTSTSSSIPTIAESDTTNVDVPFENTPSLQNNDTQSNSDTQENTTIDGQNENDLIFGTAIDTDADGLDDTRESTLRTDPDHWDSDGDELSDGDEVIIWKTDPLNPDSDGDGFLDGVEIKNGYSPTGPGKIFEPPTDTTTDTQ